jgi:hypothetical protein
VRGEELFLTVQHLKAAGHADFGIQDAEDRYIAECESRNTTRNFFLKQSDALRQGISPSFRSLLSSLNASFSLETIIALGPSICWLSRDTLLDNVIINKKVCKELLKEWGLYTAIGLPVWEGVDVVGVYIISPRARGYIPIEEQEFPGSAAFGILSSSSSTTVVMDSPLAALRMNLWNANEYGGTAFVSPMTPSVCTDRYQGKRTVFWSVDDTLGWAIKAMGTPSATVFHSKSLGSVNLEEAYFNDMSVTHIRERLATAVSPHQEAARRLTLITNGETAKAALEGLRLSPADKSKILSYTAPHDFERVRDYLDEGVQAQIITWNGKEVRETPGGWTADGKIISAAILRVDEIRAQGENGEAEVAGFIIYKGKNYSFRTNLEKLRKAPGEWITRFIINTVGSVPYIESGWKMKLLELAQQFHEPRPVFKQSLYGWDSNELRLPQFTVTRQGIEALRSHSPGPQVPLPAPLSPVEWDAFNIPGFCSLFLALTANLLRVKESLPPYSLFFVSESHVLSRIASTFCAPVLTDVTTGEIVESGYAPFPLTVSLSPTTAAPLFQGEGRRYLMTSVDAHTANLLSLRREWMKLKVQTPIEYAALRGIFRALPELLRLDVECRDSDDLFRLLAQAVISAFRSEPLPESHKLTQAAFELDLYGRSTDATAATNIMRLIFAGITAGIVKPEYRLECIRIPIEQFRKYLRSPYLEAPSVKDLTEALLEAKFLIEAPDTGNWAFGRNIWDINSSMASVYAG